MPRTHARNCESQRVTTQAHKLASPHHFSIIDYHNTRTLKHETITMGRSFVQSSTSYALTVDYANLVTEKASCCKINTVSLADGTNRQRLSPPPTNKVSFADTCAVKLTLHLADYIDEEKSASWYSQEELAEQRRKSTRIIVKMILGKSHCCCIRDYLT